MQEEILIDEVLDEESEEAEEVEIDEESKEGKEEEESEGEETEKEEESEENLEEKNKKTKKDSIEAQKRREREAKEVERKRAYAEGIRKAVGGINPYTKEKMVNDNDVEIYETMLEMEENGLDPLSVKDFLSYSKEKENKKNEEENWVKKDIEDFFSKNPDISKSDFEKLLNDKDFNEYYSSFEGEKIPLNKLYVAWNKVQQKLEEKIKEKAKKIVSKNLSTKQINQNLKEEDSKNFSKMSGDEFRKEYKRITGSDW